MIRHLFKWILRLALLAAALVVLLLIFKDSLLRVAAENEIRAQTGMDVSIGKFSSGIFSSVVTIENLKLYNTPAFGGTPFLEVRELHVEFDRAALAQRKIRVTLARFNLAEVDIVKNELGQTNVASMMGKIPAKAGARGGIRAGGKDFKFDGIDVLNLSIGRARFVDLKDPRKNRDIRLNLQNQIFKNVKSESDLYAIAVVLWLRSGGQLPLNNPPDVRL